ncbi:immunoglobulin-like domain-containing protein [Paucisalibacillus globulus]
MVVKSETVSPTGLTVTFENNTDKQCIYGEDFLLEKKKDGEWFQSLLS